MQKIVEITDKKLIKEVLSNAEYGTLALCTNNKPYSLPINFVEYNNEIFFHGAKKGKKIDYINKNANASFSVVEAYSLLPSYFSTDTENAAPATHLFKSIIIDGKIEFVEDYNEKAQALEALMKKYQKEGNYTPLHDSMYEKIITATCIYKLIPEQTKAKFKLGQAFTKERYERVTNHLKQRGTPKDLETLKLIEEFKRV
ncbi:pyridoxamine 5'-phosphate oxidase family protein [Arcobacter sp.]|uniref:pyridoxamine 5'-phosphate oxidase family protein n=1 Tax=unclassified Arcobacter TaxID=2593671 RepID=UPI003AFFB174